MCSHHDQLAQPSVFGVQRVVSQSHTGSITLAALVLKLFLAANVLTTATSAHALELWPFKSRVESLVKNARKAREAKNYNLANALLNEASSLADENDARVLRERGLLARDRGQTDVALKLLGKAGDLSPDSNARVEQSALLVNLGRWPEAVVVLRQAFEERRDALPVASVKQDPVFAQLVDFEPYKEVIAQAEEDQSGLLGKLYYKLERLEASARVAGEMAADVMRVLTFLGRLADILGFAVIVFVLISLIFTFGFNQIGVGSPPYTLLLGTAVAGVLWSMGARVASAEQSAGYQTIGIGALVLATPWLVSQLFKRLTKRSRRHRPATSQQLEEGATWLEEAARLAREAANAHGDDHSRLVALARTQTEAAISRLEKSP